MALFFIGKAYYAVLYLGIVIKNIRICECFGEYMSRIAARSNYISLQRAFRNVKMYLKKV